MKKLFITIITLILLFGCTSQKELNNFDKTYPDETSKNILSYDQVTSKELIYYSLDEYNELTLTIIERFGVEPHWITITPDYSQIGWGADIGSSNSKEDHEFKKYTSDDRLFASLYFGELTQLSDNVYSVKGEVMPSQKDKQISISDTVDYYLIFDENRLYFVFEENNLAELTNYKSDTYFTKIVNNHEESLYTPESTQSPEISPTPKPTEKPENVPASTPQPTNEPEATPTPEPTSNTATSPQESPDNLDSELNDRYPESTDFTSQEKIEIRKQFMYTLENHVSNLVAAEFGENGYYLPNLTYGYPNDAHDYFLVYNSSYPGVSIHFPYNDTNSMLNSIRETGDFSEEYKKGYILNINRLIFGEIIYKDYWNTIKYHLPEQVDFKMMINAANPWTNTIYKVGERNYYDVLDSNKPIYINCYLLFDVNQIQELDLNFNELNESVCEFASLYHDGLPVNFDIYTAQSKEYDKYAEYYLEDIFLDQSVDFYNEIERNGINIR